MDGWENFVQISNELVETLMTAEVLMGMISHSKSSLQLS